MGSHVRGHGLEIHTFMGIRRALRRRMISFMIDSISSPTVDCHHVQAHFEARLGPCFPCFYDYCCSQGLLGQA